MRDALSSDFLTARRCARSTLTIAVLPNWRGHGIGTNLMTLLLAVVHRDYPAVSLSVSAANPARRLYEHCGFVTTQQEGGSLTMCLRFQHEKG